MNLHTESHPNPPPPEKKPKPTHIPWNTYKFTLPFLCQLSYLFLATSPTLSFLRTKLLWGNIAHCGKHRDPSVLKFGLTTSLEVLNAAISGKACGIPEPGWRLHTQLVLERSQRRGSVVGPVSPCASGQAILHGIVWCDQLLRNKTQKSQQDNLKYVNVGFITFALRQHHF